MAQWKAGLTLNDTVGLGGFLTGMDGLVTAATAGDEERFFTLLHAGFGSKRKQLGKLLAPHTSDAAHERCDVSKNTRAEDVPLECWLCLAKAFRSARSR